MMTEIPSSIAGINVNTSTGAWDVALSGDDIRVMDRVQVVKRNTVS